MLLMAAIPTLAWSQVGIGTSSPAASAALELSATDKGFLPPRMTAVQRAAISSPATGLMVYQTDGTTGLYVYSGSAWVPQVDWYSNSGTTASSFALVVPTNITSNALANYGIGANALNSLTDGDGNVAIGYDAAKNVSGALYNTAVGYSALSATTGSGNTAIGRNTGTTNTSGSNNTFLGQSSNASANNLTNASAIGYSAEVTANNSIQLGNANVTKVNSSGAFITSSGLGVGVSLLNSNAAIEIGSTDKGVLLPRLSTSNVNSMQTPTEGLMIYNSSTQKVQVYTGTETAYITAGISVFGQATLSSVQSKYQTFTATTTEQIKSVEVRVDAVGTSGSTTLSIYTGTGSGGSLLSTVTQTVSSTGTVVFTLPSTIVLTPGSTYTVHLAATGSTTIYLGTDTSNPYTGGDSNFGGGIDLVLTIKASGGWVNLH
jgi:hypothetical protein